MKKISFTFIVLFLITQKQFAQFVQEPLPYPYDALEPYVDTQTMQIHYGKHHLAYINNLNAGLKAINMEKKTDIIDILKHVSSYNVTIRNNAGGHYNHAFFWTLLGPEKNLMPSEKLEKAINKQFGSMDKFKEQFINEGMMRFGSGWVWLIVDANGNLAITSTPNQDNPLMDDAPVKGKPILSIDVWEHAYYLKYQNKRKDYLLAIWQVINWKKVSEYYDEITQ